MIYKRPPILGGLFLVKIKSLNKIPIKILTLLNILNFTGKYVFASSAKRGRVEIRPFLFQLISLEQFLTLHQNATLDKTSFPFCEELELLLSLFHFVWEE